MNIQISNTNGVKNNTSYVRVYVDAIKVAEVSPSRRNPLGYMRQYQGSKYWGLMQDQIEFTGLFKLVEVNKIMSIARGVSDES
tara:strand:- start:203 stop:451 length:249 start_codon:yes stop_codon:yes gene_type:complete